MTLDPTLISEPSVPEDATILRQTIEFRLGDLHTAMPAKVLVFNPAENTCNVQPLLKRIFVESDGTEVAESCPILVNVPIVYPRGGGFRFTWPLRSGDIVLILCCERSIDAWSQHGGELEPNPPRKFDFNDAVAFPGLSPVLTAIGDVGLTDLVIGMEGGANELRIAPAGITVNGIKVDLGGSGGQPVGRIGDGVSIDPADPANAPFFAWISAISSAAAVPSSTVPAFTGAIHGRIVEGSTKVSAT